MASASALTSGLPEDAGYEGRWSSRLFTVGEDGGWAWCQKRPRPQLAEDVGLDGTRRTSDRSRTTGYRVFTGRRGRIGEVPGTETPW